MRTVLIAQRERDFASTLAGALTAAGYRAITCPGPWPPALRCIRCDVGYCPLTESADLLVYDPGLIGYDERGRPHALAVDSGTAHPDEPLLLAWPGGAEPGNVELILERVPGAQRAATEPGDLVEQVRQLIGSPFEVGLD